MNSFMHYDVSTSVSSELVGNSSALFLFLLLTAPEGIMMSNTMIVYFLRTRQQLDKHDYRSDIAYRFYHYSVRALFLAESNTTCTTYVVKILLKI